MSPRHSGVVDQDIEPPELGCDPSGEPLTLKDLEVTYDREGDGTLYRGTFDVTYQPFETYVDYWGSYRFDAATGKLDLKVEGGNFVPSDIRLNGTARRENGKLQLEDGTLAGSNLTMDEAVRHCVQHLKLDLAVALRMASLTPARFLRMEHELGRIVPGHLASLVHLGDDLTVRATWINGL